MATSILPSNNHHLFQSQSIGSKSFKCQLPPIPSKESINSTRLHLSNLDKLLRIKQPQFHQIDRKPLIKTDSGNGLSENKRKSLMEGLNLDKIWPEFNAGDEISPRRLNYLLSKSTEYSPRNHLGTRWREYHGCGDWKGLVDPLDENLRREVVKYGEFIQSAYRCFHSNSDMSFEENLVLPDRSYKVTKSLYATSSIGLPDWVDDMAPDLGWMSQRSSWIGYVAVCDDRREIQRMGRRDIVISLRGTATCMEWAENVRTQLVQVSNQEHDQDQTSGEAKVECGFWSLFKTRASGLPSLAESVVEEIRRLIQLYKGETLSITVTGHSLGAALALLVADELSTCAPDVPPVAVFSFGGPRVGNQGFVDRINSKNVKVLRIVNNQDVITKVPGMFVNESMDKSASTWVYSHVGIELRVDTKMSPYLKPNADVACCHDLEAYLHLVDGFLASNCPFRANAKRSLVKLLKDQGSNVKKLYIKKAKPLSVNLEFERFPVASCLPSPS